MSKITLDGQAINEMTEQKYRSLIDKVSAFPIVCLVGHSSRPGTGFLNSLLDNHPQIMQIPHFRESYIWDYTDYKDQKEFWPDRFLARNPEFFSSHLLTIERFDRLGKSGSDHVEVNRSLFKDHLTNLLSVTDNSSCEMFFRLVHIAYTLTINTNEKTEKMKIIFYHSHTKTHTEDISKFLKKITIIFMARNPANGIARTLESVTKNLKHTWAIRPIDSTRKSGASPELFYEYIKNNLEGMSSLTNISSKIILLSYERLHEGREKILVQLSYELNIDFHLSMLDSTFWGLQWQGDTGSTTKLNGFNDNPRVDKWKNILSPKDVQMIEELMRNEIVDYGMDRTINIHSSLYLKIIPSYLLILWPMKYEITCFRSLKWYDIKAFIKWNIYYLKRILLMIKKKNSISSECEIKILQ